MLIDVVLLDQNGLRPAWTSRNQLQCTKTQQPALDGCSCRTIVSGWSHMIQCLDQHLFSSSTSFFINNTFLKNSLKGKYIRLTFSCHCQWELPGERVNVHCWYLSRRPRALTKSRIKDQSCSSPPHFL